MLNSVTVDSTGDTKDRFGRWNNGGPKTYTLTVGDEKIDLSNKNLGSADVALVATWMQRPEVMAALTSIVLDGQPISGTTPKYGYSDFRDGVDKVDADLGGFKLLCGALASSKIEVVSMQSCYLGPQALALLTDALKVMAALTEVDVRSNEGLDEAAVAALRAAAPETCKILADYY